MNYIHEPDPLQCGQAVLAMLCGITVDEVVEELSNPRETTLAQMKSFLRGRGSYISDERIAVNTREELPDTALLSLETPRCWHWSLYHHGTFYDPEHGVMDDFPEAKRKYYWEIRPAERVM